MSLGQTTNHLTTADRAITEAITALKAMGSAWADERVKELLDISNQLGDTITRLDDILNIMEHHGTPAVTDWGTRQYTPQTA